MTPTFPSFIRIIFYLGSLLLCLSPQLSFAQNYWLDRLTIDYDDCDGCVTVRFLAADNTASTSLPGCMAVVEYQDRIGWLELEFKSPTTTNEPTYTSDGTFFFIDDLSVNRYANMTTVVYPEFNNCASATKHYWLKSGATYHTETDGAEYYGVVKFCDMPDNMFNGKTEILLSGYYDFVPNPLFSGDIEITENTSMIPAGTQLAATNSPSGLSATTGQHCDHVRLTWSNNGTNCPDATNFTEIHRAPKGTSTFSLIGTVPFTHASPTTYSDYGVALDADYDYRIRHKFQPNSNRTSLSSFTGPITGYKRKSPDAPTSLTATRDLCDGSIDLSWSATSTGLSGIKVYRNGTDIATLAANVLAFTDATTPVDQDVNYEVQALSDCSGVSSQRSVLATGYAEGPPAIPTNVMADTTLNGIKLTWTDNSNTEAGYILERTVAGGGSPFIIDLPPNTTTHTDTQVLQCITYTYTAKVKTACHPDGAGTNSAFNALGPDLTSAFATDGSGFRASKGYFTDRVELSWTNRNEGQTNIIKVYRRVLGSGDPFVLIASQNANSGIYNDNSTDAGVLYEYQIQAEGPCGNNVVQSNIVSAVGFRSKSGIVSGNVAYEGGIAVEHVKIVGERDGITTAKSIDLNGDVLSIPHHDNQYVSDQLVIEAWIKPRTNTVFDIISKALSYRLYHDTDGLYKATVWGEGGSETTASFDESLISLDNWYHVATQIRNDSLIIYLNGDRMSSVAISNAIDVKDNTAPIRIGQFLPGCMKEVRIWSASKTDVEIKRNASRYAIGSDIGLIVLLPMDEGTGDSTYDRSQSTSALFNRNHASMGDGASWVNNAPTSSQLSYAAYTDANGNYAIKLTYINAGENYTLTPIFNTHEFDPSTQVLFVGDGSTVINGVDFTDISAFTVTGTLFYDSTTCAVDGAQIKIDGEIVIKNGTPVETDVNGNFEVLVPIGQHVLTIEKPGHVFNQGRFPTVGSHDFQAPISGIVFKDATKVRVVGRVVGGLIETNKKPGLGLSKNNIGTSQLIFSAQQGGGCHVDTAYTDNQTGEYQVSLPPLNYVPEVSVLSNATIDFGVLDVVNLSGTPMTTTVTDTLFDTGGNVVQIDSASFEKRLDYVHRVLPEVIVRDVDGKNNFIGDTLYTYQNADTSLVRNLRDSPLRWPIFTSTELKYYSCLIMAFEKYINHDNGLIDSVSTTDGTININNELALDPIQSIELSDINFNDSIRFLVYQFTLGEANLLANQSIPAYSFTNKFEINLITANGTNIPWEPVMSTDPAINGTFRGYILAPKSQGQQFVTKGPERPEFILRDPPGSGSSASRTVGSSDTRSSSWSWDLGVGVTSEDYGQVGIAANLGTPFAETETDIFVKASIGLEATLSGGRGGSFSTTTTNEMEWSTDATATDPGANSDLYIGTSQNVQFGITQTLAFVPEINCASLTCVDTFAGFGITKILGLSIKPGEYATAFIYSQFHIEETLIPQLRQVRNGILQSDPRYQSHLPVSDTNYGKNNDDPVFGNQRIPLPNGINQGIIYESLRGPSYDFNASATDVDSVRLFNTQINIWEEAIRLNEWEKLNIEDPTAIDSLKQIEFDLLNQEYGVDVAAYFIAVAVYGVAVVATLTAAVVPAPGASVGGTAAFSITGVAGVAVAELSQRFIEYEQKRDLITQRFSNLAPTNYSISSGASFGASLTHAQVASMTRNVEFGGSTQISAELQGLVNNSGIGLTRTLSMNFKQSRDWGTETESSETVAFTLSDEDRGDFMSVDVYPSIFGWGPIFKRRAGGITSCPHEGEEVTKYYNPGTVISEATQRGDDFSISASPTIQTNIPSDQAAAYNLTIGNLSASSISRSYIIEVYSESNPFGAIVKIDGVSASTEVFMGPGTSINKVITIEKGAGPVYEYNDIQVAVYAACESARSEVVELTAHFLPTCTEATLASPEDQWVLNNSFKDTMPITLIDYNINTFDLKRLRFDYKSSDDPNWIAIQSFWKDTTGLNDPNALLIPTSSPFTSFDWPVDQIPDGSYDLRVVSVCEQAQSVSPIHRGYMDRINPHAFGTPSPGDGILDPGDDVLITLNEPVETGSITSLNFDVRGVLNGTPLRHETSLAFDGSNDYATIPEYQLQQRSMTIEFWLKRAGNNAEVILSQSPNETDKLNVFFDAGGHINLLLGDRLITATTSISDNDWHHYALVYDRTNQNAEILIDFILDATDNNFVTSYTSSGSILIGKDISGASPQLLQGTMHELRLWSIPRTVAEIAAKGNISLSGREAGLIGNWPMEEGYGIIASDKVRSRHAQLSGTTWSILPDNHAFMFDGVSHYLEAPNGGSIAFAGATDMTIEAWFKTGAGKAQSILSNGKADGSRPEHTAWNIHINSAGAIVIENDGHQTTSPPGYNDNNWHHISTVVERTRAVTLYIDGQVVATGNADDYNAWGGPKLWIGCRGWLEGGTEMRDMHWEGAIDDIRIWNIARASDQITRDFVYQLQGDEAGLEVYYPFDGITEDAGILGRVPIRSDASTSEALNTNNYDLLQGGGVADAYSTDAPPIQLPRLIEKANITYSINNDQIFIDITDPPARVENVTLDITVSGIKDLAGNVMQSPVTWIAYVDKNQVFWEEEYFTFIKNTTDPLSFTTKIKNTGGSQEQFRLSNIPPWLTVSPTSGLINPNSSMDVTFQISSNINIGTYEQDIFVTTESFGFNERLLIDLEVKADPPDWTVDPTEYSTSMSYIGEVTINGIISTDEDDIIAATIDGELRGLGHVTFSPGTGKHLVFLDIYGGTIDDVTADNGKSIVFRMWDASTDKIHPYVTPDNHTFEAGTLRGGLSTPVPFIAQDDVEIVYDIRQGWNWISFPLESVTLDSFELIVSQLNVSPGDRIASHTQSALYVNHQVGWQMSQGLRDNGLSIEDGYRLYLSADDTLVYRGVFQNPEDKPIHLNSGWNSVGFISEDGVDISTALSSLDPSDGDWIKGQQSFAVYESGFGWNGSLQMMDPKASYLINVSTSDILTYPDTRGLNLRPTASTHSQQALYTTYGLDPTHYEHSMSMVATVDGYDHWEDHDEWLLTAYSEDEIRGVHPISIDEVRNLRLSYLTMYGIVGDTLTFKLISGDGSISIPLNEEHAMIVDGTMGLPSNPIILTVGQPCVDHIDVVTDYTNYLSDNNTIRAAQTVTVRAPIDTENLLSLEAGESIFLQSGFEATIGSTIEFFLKPCEQ